MRWMDARLARAAAAAAPNRVRRNIKVAYLDLRLVEEERFNISRERLISGSGAPLGARAELTQIKRRMPRRRKHAAHPPIRAANRARAFAGARRQVGGNR